MGDVVVRIDLDIVFLCRGDDLPSGRFLLRFALEIGLVEPGHRVANVGLVVDWQVLRAVGIDVGELATAQLVSCFRIELSHCRPPVGRVGSLGPQRGNKVTVSLAAVVQSRYTRQRFARESLLRSVASLRYGPDDG